MNKLDTIRDEIINHPDNVWAKKLGYPPVYTASEKSKIVIVGQAPGRKAQDSRKPWNDVSGDNLRLWLDLTREVFYDDSKIALIPMDFFYPGKGVHGDLPPRRGFAAHWHPKLLACMPDVELTLLVGSYAQKYYLAARAKRNLTETVKNYKEYLPEFVPMVHPSPLNFRWRRINPWFEAEVVPEARKLVHKII